MRCYETVEKSRLEGLFKGIATAVAIGAAVALVVNDDRYIRRGIGKAVGLVNGQRMWETQAQYYQ